MNVSVGTVDIHQLELPGSATVVQCVLVLAMIVYIVSTVMAGCRRGYHKHRPLLVDEDAAGPVVL